MSIGRCVPPGRAESTGPCLLAAEHGLDALGPRNELVGLAYRELLARLGLDMVDEAGQVQTRLRGVVGGEIGLHRLQLPDVAPGG